MREKGFTLIEMLVVLSVMALLAVVVLAAVQNARNKGRYSQMVQQMRLIVTAAEAYRNSTGGHATEVAEGAAPAFVTDVSNKWLEDWPGTPCKNSATWRYDWDNIAGPYVRVAVDENVSGVWTPRFVYCLVRTGNICDPVGPPDPQEVINRPSGSLSC